MKGWILVAQVGAMTILGKARTLRERQINMNRLLRDIAASFPKDTPYVIKIFRHPNREYCGSVSGYTQLSK